MTKRPSEFVNISITNEQIYNEVKSLREDISSMRDTLSEHKKDINVKLSWVKTLTFASFGFSMFILGTLLNHIMK